jgi:hypothetical protein
MERSVIRDGFASLPGGSVCGSPHPGYEFLRRRLVPREFGLYISNLGDRRDARAARSRW